MKQIILLAISLTTYLPAISQWIYQPNGFAVPGIIRYLSVPNDNVVWATASDTNYNSIAEFTKTIDGGNSWTAGTIPVPSGMRPSSIMAINENRAWVPMYDGINGGGAIYATVDGGQTWQEQTSAAYNAPDGFPNFVHFFDVNNGVCMGDPTNGYYEIYTTVDGGNNWIRVPQNDIPAPLSFDEYGLTDIYGAVGDRIWFGTTKGRMFRSFDKGLTWSASATGLTYVNETAFIDSLYGIANNYYTTVYTADGGASWQLLTDTLNFIDLAPVPGTNKFFATVVDSSGSFYSVDKGLNWQRLENAASITEIAFANSCTGWAGRDHIDLSTGNVIGGGIYKWAKINGVVQNGSTLTASTDGASYEWIDCDNATTLANSTGQTYIPTESGSYAVIVTKNGCTDTSACYAVSNVGIEQDDFANSLLVYPNPNNGKFHIVAAFTEKKDIRISIFNTMGQEVYSDKIQKSAGIYQKELDMSLQPKGIYFLRLSGESEIETLRIIYH